jgi:excisionase family DNA binding protein
MDDNTSNATPVLDGDRLAYPINDLAEALGVGRTKLYAEIAAGRIRAKKCGSRTLVPIASARAYLDQLPDMKTAA